jgi:hypothetical protein
MTTVDGGLVFCRRCFQWDPVAVKERAVSVTTSQRRNAADADEKIGERTR